MTKASYTLPVYQTEDYNIFKKLRGNRETSTLHVSRLEKSIAKNPDLTKDNPIKVNEKMQIVDGQHRLEAFKRFAARNGEYPPLYYTISDGLGIEIARRMNAVAKVWTPMDYAHSYAVEGNSNYKIYIQLAEKYSAFHDVLVLYLSHSSNYRDRSMMSKFRMGEFEIVDIQTAEKNLKRCTELVKFYPNSNKSTFSVAFFRLLKHPKYDHKRMVSQMKQYGEGLASVPSRISELVAGLHMIYNYNRKDHINLLKH